jgi:catechol 2,3-dioxygenase-like lactoylglutathione lyase family enzyme
MSATKKPVVVKEKSSKREALDDIPQFFRLNVEVGDLDAAVSFYTNLLGVPGRKQPGHRCYFDCGPVTLQVLDVSSIGQPHPAAKALYFTVRNLEPAFDRAKALGCLSREDVHDAPGGGIVVRPWGERSFYAEDPWGNPLCFVEEGTVYTG